MSRREAVVTALVIFAIAVAARVLAASLIVFPKPEDTAYYVGVARNLIEGRGLVSDALWSFQTPPLVLPRPAFEVWLPLPTLLAAVPMAVLGPSFPAAQVSSVLAGAIVPVLAWRIAADVADELRLPPGRARTLAAGAGVTTAVYLPLLLHSALPDSTMPFAALALGACLLMYRLSREPKGGRIRDGRLIALGVVLGLAALARNEAAWLALTWVAIAWTTQRLTTAERVRLILVPGVVALVVFAPWMYRNLEVFGSPLPSQTAANALSVTGMDIFAWSDPPTLERYLAVGPARLLEMRVEGIAHNLFNVLLFLGIPAGVIGALGLVASARLRALRPLVLVSAITFLFTSLVFPVATTWGTFLHAAGPVHVLLVISALVVLDAAIAGLGRRRGWTRPTAWLGAALTIFGSALFSLGVLPSFGAGSVASSEQYAALPARMAAVGLTLGQHGPVITNFPIWLAETTDAQALALPDEPPESVLDLARAFPGTRTVIVMGPEHGRWPHVLETGALGAECFREIELPPASDTGPAASGRGDPLADTRVFEIACP